VRTSLSILFVAIAIAVLAGAVSTSGRQRDVWEYIINHSDSVGGLNQLGQQGWEAVAVYTPPNSGSLQILMKRRKN